MGCSSSVPADNTPGASKGNSQGVPTENRQGVPKENPQGVPKENSQGAPKENSQGAPKDNAQAVPTNNTQRVPTNDTQSPTKEIVVYGSAQSTCTQRVLMTLIEKGLKYEIKPIDLMKGEQKSAKYVEEKQPFGVIPVLVDTNGYQIYESRAICRYLEAKYKGSGAELIPTDIKAQGLFEQAASIEASYFNPYVAPLVYEKAFKKFFNAGEPDEAKVAELKNTLIEKLDVYETILSKQPYLAGDTFTLADLFHLPYGEWMVKIGDGDALISRARPNVKKWWENITSRPSWKAVQAMS